MNTIPETSYKKFNEMIARTGIKKSTPRSQIWLLEGRVKIIITIDCLEMAEEVINLLLARDLLSAKEGTRE